MKERWPEMLEYQQKVQAMTDLERAAWAAFKGDITSWPAQFVEALAAARREGAEEATLRAENAEATAYAWADADAYRRGAEEMRERAAKTAESDDWSDVYGWNLVALSIAKTIRDLPLTPEEPA